MLKLYKIVLVSRKWARNKTSCISMDQYPILRELIITIKIIIVNNDSALPEVPR